MANRKVVLLRYCKTEKGWRRHPVATGKNGRIRPNFVLVAGFAREYPEGHYEIRSYQGSRPIYRNVGNNAADALNERDKEMQLLIARDAATAGGAVLVEEAGRVSLYKHATRFVQGARDRGAAVIAGSYQLAISDFLLITSRVYADQVTAEDIAKHQLALKVAGKSARTVHNRHMLVKAFLKDAGVAAKVLAKGAPKYDKTLPEIYEADELRIFFDSLTDPYHLLIFNLLMKTGLREQEAMYLEWEDISHSTMTLTIHSKPSLGFRIKDKEERAVPITLDLLDALKAYRVGKPTAQFVLGNDKDRPHSKLLRLLKSLVKDAGLNCSRCEGCKSRGECQKWFLHKFRATYCTQLLRSGLDLRTVQAMMGHSDIASTMRYLRPQEDAHTQSKINSINWTS